LQVVARGGVESGLPDRWQLGFLGFGMKSSFKLGVKMSNTLDLGPRATQDSAMAFSVVR
jgi:hypothetical protein